MTKRLAGKRALITGGGTGIGRGIALAFAAEGARVAVAGRREAPLRETAELHPGDTPILTHTADVGERDSVETLFAWSNEQLGPLDILVCSAGVNIPNRTMAEMSPEQWDQILAVNASGAYYCLHAALPGMKAKGDGLVINISSISGKRAIALGGVAYCASKFAMGALGTAVANEVGRDGVRVTTIYPGEVDTPILENRPVKVSDEHRARILQPEDVADMALAIACLPPRAHVPELIIKPTPQDYA